MQIKDLVLKQLKGFWGEESDCENGIPVIKTNNLTYGGSIDYTDINYRYIDKEKVKENYLQKGDLLIEKSGGTKSHSVGYVSYFDGVNSKYVCNNFILCIRPDTKKCVPKYLFYQIKYKYENGKFNNCFKQTTGIQNLKVEDYLSKQIAYHDLPTQQKIVEELDCLGDIIEKKKKQLSDFDELIKSKFVEMFGDPLINDKKFKTKSLSIACPFNKFKGVVDSVDDKYWILNLDMIESNTGRIIEKVYQPLNEIGNSTISFDTECILYSKLRPYLNKVAIPDTTGYATSELISMKTGNEINKYLD